jgi:hypothetical protein
MVYKPTIVLRIKYKLTKNTIINKIKNIRSLGILNKFLKGVNITNISPVTLLIKNRG